MYVTTIHHIHDPAGFQRATAEAMAKRLPPEFKLPIRGATSDYSTAICIWEGPSLEAVRTLVESVMAPYSENEFFEMTVHGI